MPFRVKNINAWLQDRLDKIDVLVISGMGGLGKTTLAKLVYNLNYRAFQGSCFLANIRQQCDRPGGLLHLQRQLLSNIVKEKREKIYNTDEGITKITDALSSVSALLVLDDVDDTNQLNALLGRRNFCRGTKVVITTRDRWLLKPHEVYKAHEIEKLNDLESLELFSWNAFGQELPDEAYKELSERLIRHCGGVPLAHKLLGSLLSGKSIDVWESALSKLDEIPDNQILEKLKISYESLQDYHDQNLFLHIACFFVNKAVDDTINILNKCHFFTMVGIENLVSRSLIQIDEVNRISMHQLLQEMGREIVRQESPTDPGRRSRLWHPIDSYKVLKENKGTERVQGLLVDMKMVVKEDGSKDRPSSSKKRERGFEQLIDTEMVPNMTKRRFFGLFDQSKDSSGNLDEGIIESSAFAKMKRLKLLQLNYAQVKGSFRDLPSELRWLCWHGFPLKSLPLELTMENLVALDMSYSKLEQVLDGQGVLSSLKILNLSHCVHLIRTPSFSILPNLKKLILKGCIRLGEICESIVLLEALTELNLEGCKKLRKLPSVSRLRSLETLIISGCTNISSFLVDVSSTVSLKSFQADNISISQFGTTTVWNLRPGFVSRAIRPRNVSRILYPPLPLSLVSLSLANCNLTDDSFPSEFSRLSSLQKLNLSQNPICRLPDFVRNLGSLQDLKLNSCPMLRSLLDLPNLEILYVGESRDLERITYSSTLFGSRRLETTKCRKLDHIQGLFKIESLWSGDEEMPRGFSFLDSELVKTAKLMFYDQRRSTMKMQQIQGLFEFGIFSTFVPGKEIPRTFGAAKEGTLLSFTLPETCVHLPPCLDMYIFYTYLHRNGLASPHPFFVTVYNKTKNLSWIYGPTCFAIPEIGEELVWVSHWEFRDHLQGGDEVTVRVDIGGDFHVGECAVNIVRSERNERGDGHGVSYLDWNEVIGGDLLGYQLPHGGYLLYHGRAFNIKYTGEEEEEETEGGMEEESMEGEYKNKNQPMAMEFTGDKISANK